MDDSYPILFNKPKFTKELRKRFVLRNISYRDAAAELGITYVALYKHMNKEYVSCPSLEVFMRCCKWMRKDLNEFIIK